MPFGPIENEQKTDISIYFKLDPWALDPSPSDFFFEMPNCPGSSLIPSLNPP